MNESVARDGAGQPDGIGVLLRRVADLDGPAGRTADRGGYGSAGGVSDDVDRLIEVLEEVSGSGDHAGTPVAAPEDADRVLANCRLLDRLAAAVPEITAGPLARDAQYWVSTGNPPWRPPGRSELAEHSFKPVVGVRASWSVKPFAAGLYTSTGFAGTQGMWRAYLDRHEWSSLHAKPWQVWLARADPAARVLEIATSGQWADFAGRYPVRHRDLLYPDWPAAARDYDAVHLTARAIAAIHGLCLRTASGLLAPGYWDVETTYWLRWRFTSVQLTEMVEAPAGRS